MSTAEKKGIPRQRGEKTHLRANDFERRRPLIKTCSGSLRWRYSFRGDGQEVVTGALPSSSARWILARLDMLMNVSVEEVTKDPERFLHRVIEGETLVVTQHDRPVAEIRPIEAVRRPRPFGLAAGSFVVPDDFDDPLPDDVLRDFE